MNAAVPFSFVYFAVSFLEIVFLRCNAILNNLTKVHKYPVFFSVAVRTFVFFHFENLYFRKIKIFGKTVVELECDCKNACVYTNRTP